MKFFLLFLLLLVLVIGIALFGLTKVKFDYDGKILKLEIICGFLRKRLKFPKNKAKKSVENTEIKNDAEKRINTFKENYDKFKDVIITFFRLTRYRIHFQKLELKLEYGCGDAAKTGILYGVIWGGVSTLYNILNLYFNADYPEVDIKADFNNKKFDILLKGILKVRLVHIIIAIIKIFYGNSKQKYKEKERSR